MSSRDRADIRPSEDLYDAIDRLVDEDPIALRDLAWKLLAERDVNAIEHNAARTEVDAAEARGYRKAIEALHDGERIAKWIGLKATGEASQQSAINYLSPAAEYLEATEATQ